MKRWIFSFALLLGLCVPGTLLAASSGKGLVVSPMFQEIALDQNESEKTFPLSVTNTTEQSSTLRLSVLDFGSLDESGGVAFLGASDALERKYALASWMRPEKDVVTLPAGATQEVRVVIENRDSLSPGGHYAALILKVEGDTGASVDRDQIAVQQLFSVLVFVKKIGGEIYDLELVSTDYQKNFVMLPESIKLRFQNVGNVHVVPRGIITVTDPWGRVVEKGIINSESGIIMPETFRVYPLLLKSLARAFVPGRYTLDIAYRYDGKEDFIVITETFDFIPLPVILLCLILVAIPGWYVAKRRSSTGEKQALSGSSKTPPTDV